MCAALRDDELYRSGDGVVLNSLLNRPLRKTTLARDGDFHAKRRRVLMGSLDAKALARIEPHLDAATQATVDDLVGRQSFDPNGPLTSRRVLGAIPTAITLWLYTALLNQARSRCPGTYWKSLTISPTCPDTSSGCAGSAASPAPDPQALHLRGFAGRTLGGVDSQWLDAEIECVWLLFGQRQRLRDKRHRAPPHADQDSLWRRT
jgi:hypothetical protein